MSETVKKQDATEPIEFRYLRHGNPVPTGWALADKLEGCRHGWYAVLIRKVDNG